MWFCLTWCYFCFLFLCSFSDENRGDCLWYVNSVHEIAFLRNQKHQLKRWQYFIFSKRKRSRAVQSPPTDFPKRIRFGNDGNIVNDVSSVTGPYQKPLERKKRMVSTSTQCDAVSSFLGLYITRSLEIVS